MAAEAPDGHSGGLGRVEEVSNDLTGGHPGGYREEKLKILSLLIYCKEKALANSLISVYLSASCFFGPLEYVLQSL